MVHPHLENYLKEISFRGFGAELAVKNLKIAKVELLHGVHPVSSGIRVLITDSYT